MFGELLLCDLVLEAVEKLRTLVAVHDVPHLGLAVLALDPLCVVVIGVYLHREVILGVDELDENGEVLEPVAVAPQNALAVLVDILL